MGRVIRHRWDYGAVILADKRFGDSGSMGQMSAWLKDYVVQHGNFGMASASLTRFFKVRGMAQRGPFVCLMSGCWDGVAAWDHI